MRALSSPISTASVSSAPLALLVLALAFTGCGIRGSGVAAEDPRPLDAFVGVVGESSVDVEVEVQPDASQTVTVECDDNLIEYIQTSVEAERLIVSQEPGSWLQPQVPCLVRVVVPRLEDAEVAGSGDVVVFSEQDLEPFASARVAGSGDLRLEARLTGAAVALTVAGSGDLFVDRFDGEALTAAIEGSGSIFAEGGEGRSVDARIEGSGDIELAGVTFALADVSILGSGSVEVAPPSAPAATSAAPATS